MKSVCHDCGASIPTKRRIRFRCDTCRNMSARTKKRPGRRKRARARQTVSEAA